jgi:hypothetical protein
MLNAKKFISAIVVAVFFAVGLLNSSCKKDLNYELSGNLGFTNDTLIFDTVFTTVGSVTKRFSVYNPSRLPVKIDRIYLAGGSTSPFRVNVDGIPADIFTNVEIPGGDSLFVFAEVTLNVNGGTYPMIIEDSLVFETNGQIQSVKLVVWGQDAYFHTNELVSGTWPTDKPHVIYGTAAVGYPKLDSNLILNIPAGAKIHLHKNSTLFVYKSTLNVQGTEGNEVVFTGDRLDAYYRDLPGQWNGIYMLMSNNSTIEHAKILNAVTAVRCDTVYTSGTPALTIRKTEINNNTFAGILGLGSYIVAENCLIADAGSYCAYLGWGGTYQLNHCTMANYYGYASRSTPSLVINNFYEAASGYVVRDLNNCMIQNSIIYGSLEDELGIDTVQYGIKDYQLSFCNLRKKNTVLSNTSFYNNLFVNTDPGFSDINNKKYDLLSTGFARNQADAGNSLPDDIDDKPRGGQPDLGCYEFQ